MGRTRAHRLWDHSFLVSGVCPLMGEAGLGANLDFLQKKGWCLPSGGWSWFSEILGSLSAEGCVCVLTCSVVWPEAH